MSTNKYEQQDSHRGIIRSTSIISLGTLSSRLLGFVRDIVLAKMLGTAMRADAFFVALRIPNLFRDIVGEGATNSAVVPVVSEYAQNKSKEELWRFVSVLFVLALIMLSAITVVGIIFAPVLVRVIAPGFLEDPQKLELTIRLTRLMFPYLIFIGLTAYFMGILYTFRSFYVPAFSPCLLNVAIIISAFFASKNMPEPTIGLAIGVLIGGIAQLVVQIGPVLGKGIRFRRPKTLVHPGARQIGRLLIPRLFGTAIYQLTIFVDTFCASLSFVIGTGGIAAVYYANRIVQFPLGVVSIALASAILPTLSAQAVRQDIDQLKKTLIFSLKNTIFVMLPSTVFLLLLSTPVIRILFERGAFNAESTRITSLALMFYALGLVGFGGIKIMVTAFHALQDTKTPVRIAAWCLAINTVLKFLLMWPLKIGGIALASAIAATVNFIVLFIILDRRLGQMTRVMISYFGKTTLATLGMGLAVILSMQFLTMTHEVIRLILTGVISLVAFCGISYFLKIEQIGYILRWISARR
ncbi:MAG: murein biosynthesis integral membrane protein MurJ [Candidatus Omnitrophota bacterium]